MTRGTLFHELRVDPGGVAGLPLWCHVLEYTVPHGASLPVGNDLLLVYIHRLVANGVIRLRPGVKDLQVFHAVAGELWIGRNLLRSRASFSHDQLALADVDGLFLAEVLVGHGPQDGIGVFALVVLIKVGHQLGALARNGRDLLETLLTQRCHSLVHRGHPPIFTSRPWAERF